MRKWGVWLAVVAGVVALMYFDYLWEFQILYTIRRWVDGILRFISP